MTMDRSMPVPRRAFSLLELVVVIAIILVLAGLSLAAVGVVRASQRKSASLALVQSVALAIEAYQTETLMPRSGSGVTSLRPMWDIDLDFVLDPAPAASASVAALAPAWYGGFAAMIGGQLPAWAVDAQGRVVDRWQSPLRLDWPGWRTDAEKDAAGAGAARGAGARLYGAAKLGVWSLGPDRADGAPGTATQADNLRSW